jgi:hypothetical protein
MFGAAGRLSIGMTEMPAFPGTDIAAEELPVDELGALAGGTSSTAHHAGGYDRRQVLPRPAVGSRRVLRPLASTPEPPTLRRAEPLVVRDGQELARAAVALALSVGPRHPVSQRRRTACPAGGTDPAVSVRRIELERTATTGLLHDRSPRTSRRLQSGGETIQGGVDPGALLKKPCITPQF